MFKESNMTNMKSLMEGKGFLVRAMYTNPYTDFEGACVYLGTNILPPFLCDDENG
jgi:hypothetical protein